MTRSVGTLPALEILPQSATDSSNNCAYRSKQSRFVKKAGSAHYCAACGRAQVCDPGNARPAGHDGEAVPGAAPQHHPPAPLDRPPAHPGQLRPGALRLMSTPAKRWLLAFTVPTDQEALATWFPACENAVEDARPHWDDTAAEQWWYGRIVCKPRTQGFSAFSTMMGFKGGSAAAAHKRVAQRA